MVIWGNTAASQFHEHCNCQWSFLDARLLVFVWGDDEAAAELAASACGRGWRAR